MIHPAWFICLSIRLALVYWVRRSNAITDLRTLLNVFLLVVALGFLYKAITGSNAETQIAKVFWHETRVIHFFFYFAATVAFYMQEEKLASNMLAFDVIFSILYRIVSKQ